MGRPAALTLFTNTDSMHDPKNSNKTTKQKTNKHNNTQTKPNYYWISHDSMNRMALPNVPLV